jgi:P4 family phage/plasmid primase-like protien
MAKVKLKPKDGRAKSSKGNGHQGGRPTAPAFYSTAKDYLVDNELDVRSSKWTLRHWRGSWYKFNGHGWQPWSEEDVKKGLMAWLENHNDYGPWASDTYIKGLMSHMISYNMCGLSGAINMPVWISSLKEADNWIGFKNKTAINVWNKAKGLAKAKTTLTPDLFTTDVVDYDYDSSARCPKFDKYLKRVLPSKDSRDVIQEMFGLMLANTCKYEVFFYLYGPTARNGKSVLLNIMTALLGRQNVSHVPIEKITERFESWPLAESKVNIYGDMATDTGRSSLAHVEGLFKDLISGANIEYQKKGQDKFIVPCRARFVFAGNSLPTFVDRSDAIWERLRLVHFPVQIPASERDPNLADRIIKSELPGIFNWALKGLKRVSSNNGIADRKEGIDLKKRHRLSCDHEGKYLEECGYVYDTEAKPLDKGQVYKNYKEWMLTNGYQPKGAGRFYRRVLSLLPGVGEGRARLNGVKNPVKVFMYMGVI